MKAKIILASLCLGASGAAFAAPQGEDSALLFPAANNGPSLSRAEVRADLALWTRAGLPQHVDTEAGPEFNSPDYREAYARYQRSRDSAAYGEAVRRIADSRGGHAASANGG